MARSLAPFGRPLSVLTACVALAAACHDPSSPALDPIERQRALWRRYVETSVFTYDSLMRFGEWVPTCTLTRTEAVFEQREIGTRDFACGSLFFWFPSGTAPETLSAIAAGASGVIVRISPGVPGQLSGYATVDVPVRTEKRALLRLLDHPTTTGIGIDFYAILDKGIPIP